MNKQEKLQLKAKKVATERESLEKAQFIICGILKVFEQSSKELGKKWIWQIQIINKESRYEINFSNDLGAECCWWDITYRDSYLKEYPKTCEVLENLEACKFSTSTRVMKLVVEFFQNMSQYYHIECQNDTTTISLLPDACEEEETNNQQEELQLKAKKVAIERETLLEEKAEETIYGILEVFADSTRKSENRLTKVWKIESCNRGVDYKLCYDKGASLCEANFYHTHNNEPVNVLIEQGFSKSIYVMERVIKFFESMSQYYQVKYDYDKTIISLLPSVCEMEDL